MGTELITSKADLFLDETGLFRWNFLPKADINLDNAEEGYRIVKDVLNSKKVPVLVDMRGARKIDKPSRDYYKNNATEYFVAGAIIISSPLSKIIANFFLGLNRPPMPMKIVNSEEEGVRWLKAYIVENNLEKTN